MKEGKITLSQEQLKTLTVINRFIDKSISRNQAAELLDLSPRQISRIKKGVLASGPESLIHKNTGRKPAHAISAETKEAILSIYSSDTKMMTMSMMIRSIPMPSITLASRRSSRKARSSMLFSVCLMRTSPLMISKQHMKRTGEAG